MRLFELRRAPPPVARISPIILVVAESAETAKRSFATAIGAGAIPLRTAVPETWSADDLGPHDGPEPLGSVFVDGVPAAGSRMPPAEA